MFALYWLYVNVLSQACLFHSHSYCWMFLQQSNILLHYFPPNLPSPMDIHTPTCVFVFHYLYHKLSFGQNCNEVIHIFWTCDFCFATCSILKPGGNCRESVSLAEQYPVSSHFLSVMDFCPFSCCCTPKNGTGRYPEGYLQRGGDTCYPFLWSNWINAILC